MQEKEIKILLTEEKYDLINSIFKWDKKIVQTNHYYIDKSSENMKITVRVREIDGEYKLQIKVPVSREKSLHVNTEYELSLSSLPEVIPSETIYRLTEIKMGDCTYAGSLKTIRKVYNCDEFTEICLDDNTYFGKRDYELEVEYINEIDEGLLDILRQNLGSIDFKAKGKVSRFMKEYKITCTK